MTVMSATFGALSEVQFMHAICCFEAQEVKNPMLQTVRNSKLKWRSYSHCKPITPSWRKNFCTALWNHPFVAKWFRSLFEQCDVSPSKVARHISREGSLEPQGGSQLRSPASLACCCEMISQPSWVSAKSRRHHFSCEMVPEASRYLLPTLGDIFHQIFVV